MRCAQRAAIARDLHDIVAHSLSLILLQAEAANACLTTHPQQAGESIAAIASISRHSMAEIHELLERVRTGDDAGPADRSLPNLGDLDGLLAGVRSAGLLVESVVEGRPRPLPAAVDT